MKTADIRCVIRYTHDGMTYGWYVSSRDHQVSSSKTYINRRNGRTVTEEYPFDRLPKFVQRFIDAHSEALYADEYYDYSTGTGYRKFIIE